MQQEYKENEINEEKVGVLKFNSENYNTLKSVDFSELKDRIVFIDSQREIELPEADLQLFQIIINEEIAGEGMDNQDTVNEYGIKLYKAYDEMLEQCE